jgi:glutathione S-transferase
MTASRRVVFYHSPQSRSAGTLVLLEELGADYELRPLDLQKKESRSSEYLGVNPMGKVPAIVHEGALVTEQGAVYTYLADLYPEAASRRRSATRCAARTCAGCSSTTPRSSRP